MIEKKMTTTKEAKFEALKTWGINRDLNQLRLREIRARFIRSLNVLCSH